MQFTFAVPNITYEGADPVVICEAYEQCWADGVDTMSTGLLVEEIVVWPKDNIEENNNMYDGDAPQNYCMEASDCAEEDQWINLQTCVNGFCTDMIDFKNLDFNFDFSDDALGEWFEENTVISIIGACLIIILGLSLIYKEPKPKRY